jgi:hypothetical protein
MERRVAANWNGNGKWNGLLGGFEDYSKGRDWQAKGLAATKGTGKERERRREAFSEMSQFARGVGRRKREK